MANKEPVWLSRTEFMVNTLRFDGKRLGGHITATASVLEDLATVLSERTLLGQQLAQSASTLPPCRVLVNPSPQSLSQACRLYSKEVVQKQLLDAVTERETFQLRLVAAGPSSPCEANLTVQVALTVKYGTLLSLSVTPIEFSQAEGGVHSPHTLVMLAAANALLQDVVTSLHRTGLPLSVLPPAGWQDPFLAPLEHALTQCLQSTLALLQGHVQWEEPTCQSTVPLYSAR